MYQAIKRTALFGAVIGVAVVLAIVSHSAGARDGVVAPVAEKLSVQSRDGKVLVRLTFDNQSQQTVYLPRELLTATAPEGRVFVVRDSSNGDPLNYIGMTVRRPPPSKRDVVALKPNGKLSNTIDITQSYQFMPGRHAYQLNLAGSYWTDLDKMAQPTPMEPASTMFAHVGK